MTDDLDDLRAVYENWTRDALSALDGLLDQLKAGDAPDVVAEEIFNIAHNIKGMGSSFGFPLMTGAGAMLCDYFRVRPKGHAPEIVFVSASIGAMRHIMDNALMGEGGEPGAALLARLRELQTAALQSLPGA